MGTANFRAVFRRGLPYFSYGGFMDIQNVKKFIKDHASYLAPVIASAETARRYYECRNDILYDKREHEDETTAALRNADNRVPASFFPRLGDQKAAYTFSYPPLFDVGSEQTNKKISAALGDKFVKICKKLCKNASLAGVAWIHYWRDAETGEFRYGVLRGEQVIPVVSDDLDERLLGVIRTYRKVEDDGKSYIVYEIWNDAECEAYVREESAEIDVGLTAYNVFGVIGDSTRRTNVYTHDLGRVPFIPFANNEDKTGDLRRIKGLIDTYDKTFNGFANDLEDIQEVIMVLTGYSGTDLGGFLENLKKYKTIKIDDGEGGVSTLNIDIPVEAREKMLDVTRKAIFMQGQGVDPDQQNFGNASGVALKFLYSLLELKAGDLETEFRDGFGQLVDAICDFYNLQRGETLVQTWTRNAIQSDTELADIASKSNGIVSQRTILVNHPFVEDAEAELKQLEKEQEAQAEKNAAMYPPEFTQNHAHAHGDGDDEDGNEDE